MAFAGNVANHQDAHGEETWKPLLNAVNGSFQGRNSIDEVLVEKKNGLNRADLAGFVFKDQIIVLEFGFESFVNNFVVAMVFAFPRKRFFPFWKALHFWQRNDPCPAIRK